MTGPQEAVLTVLGHRQHTTRQIAGWTGYTLAVTTRILDALFRRSLVTLSSDGRWQRTDRGWRALERHEHGRQA